MGTSSTEFVNVGAIPASELAEGLGRWIEVNVLPALRAPTSPGMPNRSVLYFPPRPEAWELRGVTWPLVLPPEVEVRIAPGARVVPRGRFAELVLEGPLVAPVAQVFEVPSDDLAGLDAIGLVHLFGERQRVVHPEWWGAGQGDAARDTRALQEAIFVALDRPDPLRVELLGRYILVRSVGLRGRRLVIARGTSVIAAPPDDVEDLLGSGLELRGRFAPGEAVLRCSDAFLGHAMLVADVGAPSVTLRAVSMDARNVARSCLSFELAPPEGVRLPRSAHRLHHCAFRDARESLLSVLQPPSVNLEAPVTQSAPSLLATSCSFTPTRGAVGARLAGPRSVVVDLRGCTFAGEALAMIHVRGQGLTMTNCRFENRQVPEKLLNPGPLFDELHRLAPEGGVDVFIEGGRGLRVELQPYEFLGPRRLLAIPVYGPLGWVSAQDCRSHSLQFLVTGRATPEPPLRGVRDSVVIGLHHTCDPAPLGLTRAQLPPAVQWWIAPTVGCALTLMGCRFDGLSSAAPRVQAPGGHADDAVRPPLFEYGTCSADRVIRTPTDGTVINTDVFAALDPGRVPYRPYR